MGNPDEGGDSDRHSVISLDVPEGFGHHDDKDPELAQHPMDLETKEHKKKRYISIYIVHAGMAIFSLGFSIVITGVLPYMKRLLPSTDSTQITFLYGIVVSMNPLGQMIFSPISGIISNKLGSIRLVCLVTSAMYIAGNLLYAILSVFPEDARLAMLIVARLLTGIASANNANMRSYVASSTYQAERTTQMSISSSMQSLGFIVGPAIQAAITPLKCEAIDDLSEPYFSVDMFSLAGWISVFFGIISFTMFFPKFFVEYDVMTEEREYNAAKAQKESGNETPEELPKPNYFVASVCIIAFFFYLFNFIIVETLGTPLCMDEFGWTEDKTILLLGAAMSVGGIISMGGFLSVGYLAKKYDERLMMIFLGIIPMFLSRVLMLPFPNTPSPETHDEHYFPNDTERPNVKNGYPDKNGAGFVRGLFMFHENTFGYRGADYFYSESEMGGDYGREREECQEGGADYCGPEWCDEFPGIMEWQFFLGVILTFVCYPYCLAIVQALFSKVLGPRPQGFWMGLLTSAGSLARFLGPIFVTTVYTNSGPYLSIGMVAATMVITLILVLCVYSKLVPLQTETPADAPGELTSGSAAIGEVVVRDVDSD